MGMTEYTEDFINPYATRVQNNAMYYGAFCYKIGDNDGFVDTFLIFAKGGTVTWFRCATDADKKFEDEQLRVAHKLFMKGLDFKEILNYLRL